MGCAKDVRCGTLNEASVYWAEGGGGFARNSVEQMPYDSLEHHLFGLWRSRAAGLRNFSGSPSRARWALHSAWGGGGLCACPDTTHILCACRMPPHILCAFA